MSADSTEFAGRATRGGMLSPAHQKFAEEIAKGSGTSDAYRAAYPKVKGANSAISAGSRLLKSVEIQAEIQRIRAAAQQLPGGAVLTLAEKRKWLARLLRVNVAVLDVTADGDLLAGLDRTEGTDGAPGVVKIRLADKLKAIELDNDLAGEGSEAESQDALSGLLERVML